MSQRVTIGNFPKGWLTRGQDQLNFPSDGLSAGSNVDLSECLRTRDGSTICSSSSLPVGTVRAMKQFRAPTNEKSFIIAQVDYTPQWVPGSDSAAPRYEHSAVWDMARGRMLVFAGIDETGSHNDLRAYDPATDTWTVLEPAGDLPPERFSHAAFYDRTSDCMYVLLGFGGTGFLSDVWKYDCEENAWTEVVTTGTPPTHLRGAFIPTDRVFIVYEGPLSFLYPVRCRHSNMVKCSDNLFWRLEELSLSG